MKIQEGVIILKSLPEYYNKEGFDLKRNTVRELSRDELCLLSQNPPQEIRIHQVGMFENCNYFQRTITDISFWKNNIVIFSW